MCFCCLPVLGPAPRRVAVTDRAEKAFFGSASSGLPVLAVLTLCPSREQTRAILSVGLFVFLIWFLATHSLNSQLLLHCRRRDRTHVVDLDTGQSEHDINSAIRGGKAGGCASTHLTCRVFLESRLEDYQGQPAAAAMERHHFAWTSLSQL